MTKTLCALAVTAIATLGAASSASARAFEIGHIPTCLEAVPAAVAATSSPVTISVRVVLDGVTTAQANPIMIEAARSYGPLGLQLQWSFQSGSFSTNDSIGIINQAKALFGGQRPAGSDVVYVLTSKDISGGVNGSSVAGQADCIGGVAFPENAFAVGEADQAYEPAEIGPVYIGAETPARIAAHEIGHLMGAHHHYAECPTIRLIRGDNLCTLMINDVGLAGRLFSPVNGAIVQGHAQKYARP